MDRWQNDPRTTIRRAGIARGKCVVYWMQRSQRAFDNHALEAAIRAADELRQPVVVFFALLTAHRIANLRHYAFMVEGLTDTAKRLARRGIGLVVRACANPVREFLNFCEEVDASVVVTDENPLRASARWRSAAAGATRVPMISVDADVVVPTTVLKKEQFAARTIRPRIHAVLNEYLQPVGNRRVRVKWKPRARIASLQPSMELLGALKIDRTVPPVAEFRGGTSPGLVNLKRFVSGRLHGYAKRRNRPEEDGTSRLSPYLHFGHLGPHTIALAVREAAAPAEDRAAFLEEMIVRRELAVNFVHYNSEYDRLEGCEPWALKTLAVHKHDRRTWLYSPAQLEQAETHDPLWNAAQRQVMQSGWMHGYLRMYWAKKILEWNRSPAEAFRVAVWLNDRYELDGRDPNGYAGVAWAIGGKHDRAWGPERPVYGLIRYMSLASTSRKFGAATYIKRWTEDGGE